jgi:hypothetical protein
MLLQAPLPPQTFVKHAVGGEEGGEKGDSIQHKRLFQEDKKDNADYVRY